MATFDGRASAPQLSDVRPSPSPSPYYLPAPSTGRSWISKLVPAPRVRQRACRTSPLAPRAPREASGAWAS